MQIGSSARWQPQIPATPARATQARGPSEAIDDLMRLLVENMRAGSIGEAVTARERPTDPRVGVVTAITDLLYAIAPLLPTGDTAAAIAPVQDTPQHADPIERNLVLPRGRMPRYTNGRLDADANAHADTAPAQPRTANANKTSALPAPPPAPKPAGAVQPKAEATPKASPAPAMPAPPHTPATTTKPVEGAQDSTSASAPISATSRLPAATGEKIVNQPMVVRAGQEMDGLGLHFVASKELGERGLPVFVLEPGAVLKNAQLSGGTGIQAQGDATLKDVWWRNVGEGALQLGAPGGRIDVEGGGAFNASGPVFRIDAAAELRINGFTAHNFGELVHHRGAQLALGTRIENSLLDGGRGWDPAQAVVLTDSSHAQIDLIGNDIRNLPHTVLAPEQSLLRSTTDHTP